MKKAHFVKHTACPQCNSKDNLGVYSDGSSYCFGCGYFTKSKTSPYISEENSDSELRPSKSWLVGEEIPQFDDGVVQWLSRYPDCSIEELIRRRVTTVKGSPNSLLYQWFSEQGVPCLQQVRYFPSHPKRKYITYGKPAEVLPIYYFCDYRRRACGVEASLRADEAQPKNQHRQRPPRKLVIVEDALSAIKMARSVDAMPCLGSDIPLPKITALSRFYEEVVVWLDGNMYHKAQKMAERFQLLGLKATAIYTPEDPKCYTNKEMNDFVNIS